jgi:hypothetical protein
MKVRLMLYQPQEDEMSITLFFGAFLGAMLGVATQNRRLSICKYLFGQHPVLTRSIGLALLFVLVLIPSFVLSGALTLNTTRFFWGGCLACSFIFSFFMTSCLMAQTPQES